MKGFDRNSDAYVFNEDWGRKPKELQRLVSVFHI